MIFFSLITVASDAANELKYTGRSLLVQRGAPEFQWLVVGEFPPELADEFAPLDPILMSGDINDALKRATGEYVWVLPAGVCLSDSNVLRDVKSDMISALLPDFFYGGHREDGHLTALPDLSAFKHHHAVPQGAVLYRRRKLEDTVFDAQYKHEAAFDFALRFINRVEKFASTERILADVLGKTPSEDQRIEAGTERFEIRAKLLGQHPFINRMIASVQIKTQNLKQRYPKLYWTGRQLIAPVKRERSAPITQSRYRGIFFKSR